VASNTQTIKFNAKGVAKLKKQYKELERRTRKFEKSTRGGSGALGGMVAKLGITTAALYGATKAISGIIKAGAGFEKVMSNVRAISGATGEEMKALEKNARDLGATTVFTATQVGELQTEFAKLGFTSKQIQGVTKDTLALAAASGSDLATAAAIAGGTLKAFGMDVSKTSRVTDTMALSFSSSALDMEKFTNSMQYVGPIAKAAGIGVEGATAMLGTLANNMISGSMAGTSLRKILLEAGKEGSKLADRMGGPVKSMEDFQDGLKKLRKEGLDVMAEGTDLVGARAVTAFGILLDGVDSTDKLTESLNNSAGAAQRMADIQLDNLAGKTTLLGSAMEGLGISLFDHLAPSLNSAVTGMTNLVNSMNDFMAIKTSEKLEQERGEFNVLMGVLDDLNTSQDTRNRAIEELQKNYSNYIGNIDLESASQEQLRSILKETNDEFERGIELEAKREILVEQRKKTIAIQKIIFELNKQIQDQQEKSGKTVSFTVMGPMFELNNSLRIQEKRLEAAKEENKKFMDSLGESERALVENKTAVTEYGEKATSTFTKLVDGVAGSSASLEESLTTFDTFLESQLKLVAAKEQEILFNEVLIEMYPELAEALGLLNKKKEEEKAGIEETLAVYANVADQIMNVSDSMTAYKMQNLDNERQKEISAALASTLTEEQKEAKIQLIKEKYAKEERALREAQKAPMIAQAIASTAVGVTKALEMAGPLGIALGVLVAAAGAIEVATIQAQQFATGGDFVTSGPQMIKVGDNPGGQERVQITPLSSPNINGPQGDGGITLNISAPLVDETVIDSIIPAIQKAQRMNLA